MEGPLGRRTSPDFDHVNKYPLRLLMPQTVPLVEKVLPIPGNDLAMHEWYNQGQEGACVGFACSWMTTILNGPRYAARWLYQQAQLIDPWSDTPPGQGTDVRSAFEILRTVGHRRMWGPVTQPMFLAHGIEAYRWATTVDELRTSISMKVPGVLGINWYANFDTPVQINGEWWIGRTESQRVLTNLGPVRGGHAIAYRGASDKRQALRLPNTWGGRYPDVWLPYEIGGRLINENGEAGVVSDR
jgi:hypothetical protein